MTVPDEPPAAIKAVQEWLDARGFDTELRGEIILFRKDGILYNIRPVVGPKQLDRLLVSCMYFPKDEKEKSKELEDVAKAENKAQNFLRVFIEEDGKFATSSSITFYDELTAHEFDSFLDLYAAVLRKFILTPDALKLLK